MRFGLTPKNLIGPWLANDLCLGTIGTSGSQKDLIMLSHFPWVFGNSNHTIALYIDI